MCLKCRRESERESCGRSKSFKLTNGGGCGGAADSIPEESLPELSGLQDRSAASSRAWPSCERASGHCSPCGPGLVVCNSKQIVTLLKGNLLEFKSRTLLGSDD